jgi:hypothetical protein
LTADSVAIFVLGHLTFHANGPQHQLLFFWAPFVLLHLGGQDTLTALSLQDNDLWTRHLLGLVTQVAAAGYVVSRISWPDRRLLAAMILMFFSGCFKYAERTLCLYRASPTRLTESSMASLDAYANMVAGGEVESLLTQTLIQLYQANKLQYSSQAFHEFSLSVISLVSDTPTNSFSLVLGPGHGQDIESSLQHLKSNEDRCRVFDDISLSSFTVIDMVPWYRPVPSSLIFYNR